MTDQLKSFLKFAIFLGLGIFLFWVLYTNFDAAYQEDCALKGIPAVDCSLINKLITDFKATKSIWIFVIIVAYMFSNFLRALRWNQLLEPLGYKPRVLNSLGALMIGYFANLALPRLGEVVKIGTISKYENIPFEQAAGTVVVDRILDLISLLVVFCLALVLSFGTFKEYFSAHAKLPSLSQSIWLGAIAIIGLLVLFFINRWMKNTKGNNSILSKINNLRAGFLDGLTSLKNVSNFPLLIAYTLGIWLMYYLMTYLCFFAYEPTSHLTPIAGLVVFVFGTLGMVFPSPGGMGSYQFLITQGLVIYGINAVDAFSFSNIVFFAINIFGNIFFGILFLVVLGIYNKK